MRNCLFGLSFAVLAAGAWAQSAPPASAGTPNANQKVLQNESFIRPPALVEQAVLAPWHLNASVTNLDSANERWIQTTRDGMPKLADLASPSVNIAGLQVHLGSEASRALISRRASGLTIHSLSGGKSVKVDIPSDVSPVSPIWSPDGKWVAFLGLKNDGVWIYIADSANGKVRRLSDRRVLATMVTDLTWKSDSSALLTVLVPEKRPEATPFGALPTGPHVKMSSPTPTRLRTFPDRLEDADEGRRLKRLLTGQPASVDLKGQVKTIGEPKMVASINAAHDLSAFRIFEIREPFLMIQPFSSFSRREALVLADGKEVTQLSTSGGRGGGQAPPTDDSQFFDSDENQDEQRAQTGQGGQGRPAGAAGQGASGGRPDARRSLTWAPDGKGMIHLQRSPADSEGKRKDRLVRWIYPYDDKSVTVLWESDKDIPSFTWMPDFKSILLTSTAGTEVTIERVELKQGAKPVKVVGYKTGDFFDTFGTLMTQETKLGGRAAMVSKDGSSLFFSGIQYDKDPDTKAPRPFIDKVAIADGKKERVWQSSETAFETARSLDSDAQVLLVSRQSRTQIGNDFVVNLSTKQERQVTANIDHFPAAQGLQRKRVQVTRQDGFKFWADVTLPRFAFDGVGRKAFFWFYPSETRDQKSYDESKRTRNINLYQRLSSSSAEIFALLGYVVVQPDVPIVGTAERPNDAFLVSLRNSLSSVIDELERQRLVDRRYLSIGGHSYGAFSTAHAMIQTPFFKAGIAGAGNYNRLLTPFGFQSEPRQLWEQKDVYLDMSPILRANELTGALLMYHGAEDQNIGTFPINSYRMFDALESLGKPAALYVYPYEDHGQIAMETRLDMWARWIAWLEEHVK
jgi:dipeptidyl aminopeptidase/acylaminoacyl peptidase